MHCWKQLWQDSQRYVWNSTHKTYTFYFKSLLVEKLFHQTCLLYLQVPCRSLHHHIQQLMQAELGDGNMQTGMELEFKKLSSVQTEPDRFVSANLPVNKFKNRLVNILPYESSRVCLQPMRGAYIFPYIH